MAETFRTVFAESWSHLCDLLFEGTWQPSLGRFRSQMAYSGRGDARYELSTSLMRLGGEFAEVERHLIRNFKKYALRDVVTVDSFWNWLALAQHHGLPTRLLDWTYSPLVALHFATSEVQSHPRDAVVWCANFVQIHATLPRHLRRVLEREGSDVWTVEMLDEHVPNWEALNGLGDALLFFEPPSIDQRIVNQYALFSVPANPGATVDSYLSRHPEVAVRVVIPDRLRWEVRDKLDQANINERVLFPGLDGLSAWLRRHYCTGPMAVRPEGKEHGSHGRDEHSPLKDSIP
ncbi:MAG: FRG domain-containing protein [Fimbriimonas sp.]